MAKKIKNQRSRLLPRGLSASVAGVRAGGAMAVDNALQKMIGSRRGQPSGFARQEAQRFVTELGRLKGTYVKIGQMMALFGEHLLPPVLAEALRDLSDQTEPLPWQEIEPLLRSELGERFDELVIEPTALAAASLSQVHVAQVRSTGEWICLKLQYPGLAELIDADFDAVVRMLLLARWLSAGRDLDSWLDSMRQQLHREIDYGLEAQMTAHMAALVAATPAVGVGFQVPELHPRYCGNSLLALQYMEGLPVSDSRVASLSLERRNALAAAMLELFFIEVFEWGCLQTDPNFGNYLLQLGDRRLKRAEDQLVLLDFGSALECSEQFLVHLRNTIDAGQREDMPFLERSLVELGCLPEGTSSKGRRLFAEFCLQLLEPLRSPERLPAEHLNADGQYRWADSRLLHRAGKRAVESTRSSHFVAPSGDFALIARKLTGVFTFIAVLKAEFNAFDLVEAHLVRWRRQRDA